MRMNVIGMGAAGASHGPDRQGTIVQPTRGSLR